MNKKEEKNLYELGFLLKEEDASPVKNLLDRHSAESVSPGPVVKVNLAYPIKKNSQAFFGYVRFEMEPGQAAELKKELVSTVSIIRSLVIKTPAAAAAHQPAEGRPSPFKPALRPARRSPLGTAAGKVLTNEALEKKIEEILK